MSEMRFTGDDGSTFIVSGPPLAVQGKIGCQDPGCTRMDGRCVGWHCGTCGEPSSSQGHHRCADSPPAPTPNPGSPEACEAGCICAVIDNGRGKGYMGGGIVDQNGDTVFVTREDCPLHGFDAASPAAERRGGTA